jgi:DNA invertase Pin-like site-specific DNA recombinase
LAARLNSEKIPREIAIQQEVEMNNNEAMQHKAVLYMRVAQSRGGDQTAIAMQRHACERRAAELGLAIVAEYIDIGPGHGLEKRPMLRAMLSSLDAGDIAYVIAYDHARIARTVQDYTDVVWQIDMAGAQLEIASLPHEAQQLPGSMNAYMAEIARRQRQATHQREGAAE